MDTRVEVQINPQQSYINLIDFNESAWRDNVLQSQPLQHASKRRKISKATESPIVREDAEDDRVWLISTDLEFELDETDYKRICGETDATVNVDTDFSFDNEGDGATIIIYTGGKDRVFSAAVRLSSSERQEAIWASRLRGDVFAKSPLVQGHYEYKSLLHISHRRFRLSLNISTPSTSIWSDRSLQLSKMEWWELLSYAFPTAKPEPVNARCISVKEFYEAAHVPGNAIEVPQAVQHVEMSTKLLPFQRRAVQWMLRREGVDFDTATGALAPYHEGSSSEKLPPTFFPETDKHGNTVYVSHIYGVATRDRQGAFAASKMRGGILAEEMGLGKTVELIALLSLHRRSFMAGQEIPYLGRNIRVSGASLVVVPPSILLQWQSEIEKHAPGMKVFVYKGLNQAFPDASNIEVIDEISGYDIVLTTYSVLSSDIHYTKPVPKRTFRGQKIYPVRRSPLVEISWWRVCLDEAQMIEGGHSNAAVVAREIPRINAWAITGTPVKKKLDDCFGLLLCLQFKPFCDNKDAWSRLTLYNHAAFKSLFGFLTLRHTKENVRDELVLPPQTRVPVSVPFMHVEEQNYNHLFTQMTAECRVDSLGAPINDDWDPREHYETMRSWLVRLRQTCLHPEAGAKNKRALGGRNGPLRTVEEVLELMIEQQLGRLRSDERELYSAMIKRGQLYEQQKDPHTALDLWKEVLPLVQMTIQECRTAYEEEVRTAKSAEKAIEKGNDELDDMSPDEEDNSDPKFTNIGTARMRLRGFFELEHTCYYWIGTAYHQLGEAEQAKDEPNRDMAMIADLKAKENEFYDLAQTSRRELMVETREKALRYMDFLKTKAQKQSFRTVPDFEPANQGGIESQSILDAIEELASVLNEQVLLLDEWREKLVQILIEPLFDEDGDSENQGDEHEKAVEKQEESYAYMTAIKALLAQREEVLTGTRNNLLINETRSALQSPERIHQQLFVDLIRQLDAIHYDGELMSNMRHKAGELRSLVNNLKQVESGTKPRARLELAIAEPEYKRIHGAVTSHTKAVADIFREIEFCRVSLNARIEFYRQLQSVSDSLLPADPGKRLITAAFLEKLLQEENLIRQRITRQRSKNRYLEHLRSSKPESLESPNCLICIASYEVGVLTACGHSFCKDCMLLWRKQAHTCPDCRSQLRLDDFWQITYRPSSTSARPPSTSGSASPSPPNSTSNSTSLLQTLSSISLPSSYGTKIDTITRHILHLHSTSATPKCLLFSQWSDVLDILRISLRRSNIAFASLEKRDTLGIDAFRSDPAVAVFLLHAKSQSAGLTLVNATHVFLCEPLVNLSLEAQALGRVHRIGQRRETTVWVYTVQGTVEEGVLKLAERKRGAYGETKVDEEEVVQTGEVVMDGELWECLFSAAKERGRNKSDEVRRELLAGAAEGRIGS